MSLDYEPQPYLDESGEQIGWVVGLDGDTYLCDLDMQIAGVWDDADQDFYAPDDGPDPIADAYEQRIAELEQRVNEPRPVPEVVVTQAHEQADIDRWTVDMTRQREHLEEIIGRPLTLPEARKLGSAMLDDFEGGSGRPDIVSAAERIGGLDDLDDEHPGRAREARVAFMTQRFADHEREAAAARGEDNLLDDEAPASRDQYDPDDREQRQAWMVDAMRGVTDASALRSPADDYDDGFNPDDY